MEAVKLRPYNGFKAYQWQLNIHKFISSLDDKPHTICIKASRQMYGKSAFAKAALVIASSNNYNQTSNYISPTFDLARKMFDEIVAEQTNFILHSNRTELTIEFFTGSKIKFFSAEQGVDRLRGYTVTTNGILVIDEASSIQDIIYREAIIHWTVKHNALTIMVSTPKFKVGFFYETYIKGLTDSELYHTFDWVKDYPDVPISEKILEERDNTPVMIWRSEVLGLWIEMFSNVFGEFKDCVSTDKIEIDDSTRLYVGIDWGTGSGKDWTVVVILNQFKEVVDIYADNQLSPTESIKSIVEFLQSYKKNIFGILAEENSIGKVYIDMLDESIMYVDRFYTDNNSKRRIIENLQVAIENRQITLPDNKELLQQLGVYEVQKTKTGMVTYNAPNGYHDDFVISLAIALECMDKYSNIEYTTKRGEKLNLIYDFGYELDEIELFEQGF